MRMSSEGSRRGNAGSGHTTRAVVTIPDKQRSTAASQTLIDGYEAGIIDSQPEGFGDILRMDGNQEEKMNASIRWDRNSWSATLAWFYLSDFFDLDAQSSVDGSYWKVSSHSYYNASADYRFDAFGSRSRVRFGVRNLTNERAPLADGYFGFANDAHNDFGRSYYVDFLMSW